MQMPKIQNPLKSVSGFRQRRTEAKAMRLELQRQELTLKKEALRMQSRLAESLLSLAEPPRALSPELYSSVEKSIYSNSGASNNTGWWGTDNTILRKASRIAYWESPTGRAIIDRLVDTVVGAKLDLQSMPSWDLLDSPKFADDEAKKKWQTLTEARFRNWAKQPYVDYRNERNFYKLTRTLFFYLLKDGEYFAVLRYAGTLNKNPLRIQIIPPENVRSGSIPAAAGNRLINGIEYDARDEAVAYHIYNDITNSTERILKTGPKSGRTFVIHKYLGDNERHRRGIPILSRSMPEMTKLADYQVLELQAAIINAIFAVWVKPPKDTDGKPTIPRGVQKKSTSEVVRTQTTDWKSKIETVDMEHGGLIVDEIPAGHEIESFDTKRPTAGFGAFCSEVKKSIASSLNTPLSAVEYNFNQSYTGARGELLLFWNAVERFRMDHGWDFCDVVYKMWLWGEIDREKITAPGWEYEEERNAWANASWIGNQRPDIDPLRSVKAHVEEQLHAYKTGQQIAAERGGGDYDENLRRTALELKELAAAVEVYMAASKGGGMANGQKTGATTVTDGGQAA
ncbi:MAG: hypothetical protein CVV44_03930 [Spirochaetae bacterium HGW-Spirochaetae-1]|jgi:lambda family phage portal protein|nr:MAG: hypothetical protein CVV44_03930 [Spirochaetae bacterium HGW-Spirochaetae-1]